MSVTTTWHCDGTCKRKMTEAEVMESGDMARLYAESRKLDQGWANQLLQEVFCPQCRERAAEFWDSKAALVKLIQQEVRARIDRHKNKFWAPQKLEAVKNAG